MKKNNFVWHSCVGDTLNADKKIIKKISCDSMGTGFLRASKDSNFLIHKATKALWRFSEDGKSIVPVFEEDVLTEDKI